MKGRLSTEDHHLDAEDVECMAYERMEVRHAGERAYECSRERPTQDSARRGEHTLTPLQPDGRVGIAALSQGFTRTSQSCQRIVDKRVSALRQTRCSSGKRTRSFCASGAASRAHTDMWSDRACVVSAGVRSYLDNEGNPAEFGNPARTSSHSGAMNSIRRSLSPTQTIKQCCC